MASEVSHLAAPRNGIVPENSLPALAAAGVYARSVSFTPASWRLHRPLFFFLDEQRSAFRATWKARPICVNCGRSAALPLIPRAEVDSRGGSRRRSRQNKIGCDRVPLKQAVEKRLEF